MVALCGCGTDHDLTTNVDVRKVTKLIRKPLRKDPTGTTFIQRAFLRDIVKRLAKLDRAIRDLILKEDAFGLINPPVNIDASLLTENTRFAFETDARKVAAFQKWLEDQVNAGVLEVHGAAAGQPWTAEYIGSTYKKAALDSYIKARPGLEQAAGPLGESRADFLRSAFDSPVGAQRVQMLATRSYEQLKGITSAMSAEMNRIFADGLAAGRNPRVIARELSKTITDISRKRATLIARTEIIHAYAEGQLDSFEKLGVEEVGVQAEWSTAGDDRVCPQCQALEGVIMSVKEARGLIPLHPSCRCAWIPFLEGETKQKKGQKRVTNAEAQRIAERARRTSRAPTRAAQARRAGDAATGAPVQAPPKPKLFDQAPTAIIRWMGQEGWTFKQAKTALSNLGVDVADATIRAQLRGWKTRGKIPSLTDNEIAKLRTARSGSTPPPPKPGELHSLEEIAAGRSKVYKAKLDGEDVVYKPASGAPPKNPNVFEPDYQGVDFVSREKAANTVDRELGFNHTPNTRIIDGPEGRGVVKDFVDDATVVDIEGTQAITTLEQRNESAVLDWIVGNVDAAAPENYLIKNGTGRIHAIDMGEAFVSNSQLAQARGGNIWAFSMGDEAAYGRKLPASVRRKVDDFVAREDEIRIKLRADGLTDSQIDDVFVRARAVQATDDFGDDLLRKWAGETASKDELAKLIARGRKPGTVDPTDIKRLSIYKDSELLRWMGQQGWSVDEARAAMAAMGRTPAEATIKAQLKGWKTRGKVPNLSPGRTGTLDELRKAPAVKPKPKAKKPKPPKPKAEPPAPTPRGEKGHQLFDPDEVKRNVDNRPKVESLPQYKTLNANQKLAMRKAEKGLKDRNVHGRTARLNEKTEDVSALRKQFMDETAAERKVNTFGDLDPSDRPRVINRVSELKEEEVQKAGVREIGDLEKRIAARKDAHKKAWARAADELDTDVKTLTDFVTTSPVETRRVTVADQHKSLKKLVNPKGSKKRNIQSNSTTKNATFNRKNKNAEDFLNDLIPDDAPIDVKIRADLEEGRAYANKWDQKIACDHYDRTDTFVHEMGHHIEYQGYNQGKAQAFRDAAVSKQKPEHMIKHSKGYRDNEASLGRIKGVGDANSQAYAGKPYDHGSTEIISMGVEQLYRNPRKLANENPELFDFIINVLRGNYVK